MRTCVNSPCSCSDFYLWAMDDHSLWFVMVLALSSQWNIHFFLFSHFLELHGNFTLLLASLSTPININFISFFITMLMNYLLLSWRGLKHFWFFTRTLLESFFLHSDGKSYDRCWCAWDLWNNPSENVSATESNCQVLKFSTRNEKCIQGGPRMFQKQKSVKFQLAFGLKMRLNLTRVLNYFIIAAITLLSSDIVSSFCDDERALSSSFVRQKRATRSRDDDEMSTIVKRASSTVETLSGRIRQSKWSSREWNLDGNEQTIWEFFTLSTLRHRHLSFACRETGKMGFFPGNLSKLKFVSSSSSSTISLRSTDKTIFPSPWNILCVFFIFSSSFDS